MLVSTLTGDEGGLEHVYARLAADLKFPDYFGKNLDALDECLSEIKEAKIIWNESEKAKAILGNTFTELVAVIEDAAKDNPKLTLKLL